MSLECVELWRPRRARARRMRHVLAVLLGLAMIGASIAAAVAIASRVVLVAGVVASLALACLIGRGHGDPGAWVPRMPRRWVPRRPADRRAHTEFDRRRDPAARARRASCKPHDRPRAVAIGGRRPL